LDGAPPSQNPPEFQRFRLLVAVAVGAPVAFGAVLLVVSVVVDLFFHRRLSAAPVLSPTELVTCNADVRGLLDALVRETARLETQAEHDVGAEWDSFASGWQRDWEQTAARCGFGELEGTGKGKAYDRMAWVHRNLPTTKLKVRDLLAHFSRDLGVDIAEMRDALDKSRTELDRAAGQGQSHE
jgi:hypothetical protein